VVIFGNATIATSTDVAAFPSILDVIPAKAGIHFFFAFNRARSKWIPAFAE
jgi:hypothetical protein